MGSTETPYDYIIVGAGIGGLVLASRLSEDASVNVLLVEAGADRRGDPLVEIPGCVGELYGKPEYDWDYMTEPQVHVKNRQIGQPRGRMVGGSTGMNFSIIMYPSPSDFAAWESLGNEGWGPDDMAPYLRKFHTYTAPSESTARLLSVDSYIKADDQGTQGPVPVTLPDVYGEFNTAWNETFDRLGWHNNDNPISGHKLGAFTPPLSVDGKAGRRGYAADYYTPEVAQRPNLTLLTETMVERVLLRKVEDGDVVATGIQVRKDGEQRDIAATREVIVCGGSLNSPLLLELSGIGAAELLEKHGIPVVIDRPGVGENLQDHSICTINFEVADGQVSGDVVRDPSVLQSLLQLYEQTRGGPLAGLPVSMAYLPLVDHNGRVLREDIEKLLAEHFEQREQDTNPAQRKQYEILRQTLLADGESSSQYMFMPIQANMRAGATTMSDALAKSLPENYITIMVLQNRPFSRGSIHIRSADPKERPLYDPRYLSHSLDLEILARHTQFMEQIVTTEPFSTLLKAGGRVPSQAGDLSDLDNTKDLVRDQLFHCFHPTGTCAMMPADLGGVVDTRLRVHGTRNLRVVDASIMPMEPCGNIQTTTYAVAERAADLIRGVV